MKHFCTACRGLYHSLLDKCPHCGIPRESYIADAKNIGLTIKILLQKSYDSGFQNGLDMRYRD